VSKQLAYLPRLDSLRAIAALMVVTCHYVVDLKIGFFNFGAKGVDIFFVISGFLITSILLGQKERSTLPLHSKFLNFITRRALRLFPVYYLLLLFMTFMSKYAGLWICSPGNIWHYYTYTQNYLFFKEGTQSPLLFHTWSLAVEEQFYFFWPFLIFLIPRKAELGVLLFVLALGYGFRYLFHNVIIAPGTDKGVTFIHLDTLSGGALLGWVHYYHKEIILRKLDKFALPVLLTTLPVGCWLIQTGFDDVWITPTLLLLMSVSMVHICTKSGNAMLGAVLNLRWLQSIGKISYGLYLLHKPVPFFSGMIMKKAGIHLSIVPLIQFFIFTGLAILLAALSWRFIETPFLRLKEKFDR
jgi:peptidoglycan/LPS O-acetylase OafA/YrhL